MKIPKPQLLLRSKLIVGQVWLEIRERTVSGLRWGPDWWQEVVAWSYLSGVLGKYEREWDKVSIPGQRLS
ncbi:unnamed protein product [marine sediment metagenome]|uniref:Uncharacterized protein n=1 Tax=marine sediment metagenome TaxID=412755 RepID=X1LYB8_9ZZZZ